MKKQLKQLIGLQDAESQIEILKTSINNFPEKLLLLDKELDAQTKKMEDEENKLNVLKQEYRSHDSNTQICISQIKKSEGKLVSAKTNKEYQSSLKEIDDLKKKNSQIESNMLLLLDEMDNLEKNILQKKLEHTHFLHDISLKKKEIEKIAELDNKKLVLLEKKYMEISQEIDAKLLNTFNLTKMQQSNGVVMSAVSDAVCSGCNMNIPPQEYNELQRGESLQFCPFCHRIIYWNEI